LKILVVVPSYKPAFIYGGPIISVGRLCEELCSSGHQVKVLTTTANGDSELDVEPNKEYVVEGVPVEYFKRMTKGHANISFGLVYRVIRTCRTYDVVHIQSWWNFIAILSSFICLVRNMTPIISPRGSVIPYTLNYRHSLLKRMIHVMAGRYLLRKSHLHLTSNFELQEVKSLVTPSGYTVLPNLLDLPMPGHRVYKEGSGLQLIFLSRIDPKKNLEFIISTLNAHVNLPVSLWIIGDGDHDYVQKLQVLTKENPNIQWLGAVYGAERFKYFAEADLCLLPSFNENFGNVVFESLSQGTPVITSKFVGGGDYVKENDLGWVIDLDQNEFVRVLEFAIENKNLLNDMGKRAVTCIQRDFNKEYQVSQYVEMYKRHLLN